MFDNLLLLLLITEMEGTLKITSFNCKGFKYRNYNYINDIFKSFNILMLQETWLYNFEHCNFVSKIPNCNYHAVSGMNEADMSRVGRPYGGVAIIWHKGLRLSFAPIVTNSHRLCSVKVKTNDCDTVIINVYMPNDNNSNESFIMYGDILSEISSIMTTYVNCNFIIGGDFNIDPNRLGSRNLTLFNDFLEYETLSCVTFNIVENNITYEGTLSENSFLDHFFSW